MRLDFAATERSTQIRIYDNTGKVGNGCTSGLTTDSAPSLLILSYASYQVVGGSCVVLCCRRHWRWLLSF